MKGEEASSSFLPWRFLEISSFVPQKLAPAMRATWKVDRSRLVLLRRRRNLKEQYPVTAHVPNFEFLTGCREFKRHEESKRTLKNPFASRLAEFDTTLKLLRIRPVSNVVLLPC